ncbi:MAG: hypothetical protein M5U18_07065 [Dehalococcoidia bacterium]|nr:hypothetical protein [Dehalococcoidia bacterium]
MFHPLAPREGMVANSGDELVDGHRGNKRIGWRSSERDPVVEDEPPVHQPVDAGRLRIERFSGADDGDGAAFGAEGREGVAREIEDFHAIAPGGVSFGDAGVYRFECFEFRLLEVRGEDRQQVHVADAGIVVAEDSRTVEVQPQQAFAQ